jgi:hypothetical protein
MASKRKLTAVVAKEEYYRVTRSYDRGSAVLWTRCTLACGHVIERQSPAWRAPERALCKECPAEGAKP